MNDYNQIWDKVLDSIRAEIDATSFEAWFSTARFDSFNQDTFLISLPNVFTKEWIESRYLPLLNDKLSVYLSDPFQVKLLVKLPANHESRYFLNPKYTFESFVVGNNNRFAHAASYAVAEAPSRSYNPLFIYGGVGLGKTHLMQAIGHHILVRNHNINIVYVSSEQFANELINAIKDGTTPDFRNKYRNIDVLLIDDIQFLAGKERTQEEFFHTFNALYEANRQIVISSDRPPKDIPTLESRLRSRFEWGLLTDIQPPDIETRIAILRKRAQLETVDVPNDVVQYIANHIQSNIRELEGALNRVIAYSSFHNQPVSLDLASEALKDILPPPLPTQITVDMIKEVVAEYFSLQIEDLNSKRRTQQLAFPRQIAMFLCRELTPNSLPQIGQSFGGRDHTTVIYACDKVATELKSDAVLYRIINDLKRKLIPGYAGVDK
ncbi:MAG: chromosomal replication initiator protein DnaA [Solirubrobacterales bacterium]